MYTEKDIENSYSKKDLIEATQELNYCIYWTKRELLFEQKYYNRIEVILGLQKAIAYGEKLRDKLQYRLKYLGEHEKFIKDEYDYHFSWDLRDLYKMHTFYERNRKLLLKKYQKGKLLKFLNGFSFNSVDFVDMLEKEQEENFEKVKQKEVTYRRTIL